MGFVSRFFGSQFNDKAQLALYESGYFSCVNCGNRLALAEHKRLATAYCDKCGTPALVPTRIGNWWLYKVLGGGGMGAVYMAMHRKNCKAKAAAKILQNGEQRQHVIDMLQEEARIGARFGSHPHLAQVFDYGNEGELNYLMMQLIDGRRLDELIAEHPHGYDPEHALYYALDILQALQHIYSCGYLYRDLKPENILISSTDHAVVVDFGLCMEIDAAWHYRDDAIDGSPLYMPPERIKGEGEDARADLYSLGMVLFHLLRGSPYFTKDNVVKTIKSHVKGVRLQTKHKLNGVPSGIQTFVDLLIRLDRDERYVSYADTIAVLQKLLQYYGQVPSDNLALRKRRKAMR